MTSFSEKLAKRIGELIEKGIRKCGAGHIYDFVEALLFGTPRQRFDNAKMVSDFAGMITRMSFLVVLSIFLDRMLGDATGIVYAALLAIVIFVSLLLGLLVVGAVAILASIVFPKSKADFTEKWMPNVNAIIIALFSTLIYGLILTFVYQVDRVYLDKSFSDVYEIIRSGKAYIHELTRPDP